MEKSRILVLYRDDKNKYHNVILSDLDLNLIEHQLMEINKMKGNDSVLVSEKEYILVDNERRRSLNEKETNTSNI
jgi:hypothetical protein